MPKTLPKWAKVLLTLLIVVIGAKLAWGIAYPSGMWRYKLTVAVDTPEGIKIGSAVRQVEGSKALQLLGASNAWNIGMTKGEAVVVDLGNRGILFALNRTYVSGVTGAWSIVGSAFPQPPGVNLDRIEYYRSLKAGPTEISPRSYPVFVRFRDPADPKTVEAVKPDDFAAAFGAGVALKSVTIEMTREPVTTGVVERYLPKFSRENPMSIPGQSLFPSDFRKKD